MKCSLKLQNLPDGMRFEFQFNKALFVGHSELSFQLLYKNNIGKNNQNLIAASILFPVGFYFVFQSIWIGAVLLTTSLFYLYSFFSYRNNVFKAKQSFFEKVEAISYEFENSHAPIVWEFLEEEFRYADFRFDMAIKWKNFTNYSLHNTTLIMEFDNLPGAVFYLEESEVGGEAFNVIQDYLNGILERK